MSAQSVEHTLKRKPDDALPDLPALEMVSSARVVSWSNDANVAVVWFDEKDLVLRVAYYEASGPGILESIQRWVRLCHAFAILATNSLRCDRLRCAISAPEAMRQFTAGPDNTGSPDAAIHKNH
jgi:hypothetical protein